MQETWLTDLDFLALIQPLTHRYAAYHIQDIDESVQLRGRPFGGTACIFKREIPLSLIRQEKRLQFFKLGTSVNIVHAHLPTCDFRLSSAKNEDRYRSALAPIEKFIEDHAYTLLLGDLNADIRRETPANYRDFILKNTIARLQLSTNLSNCPFTFRTDRSQTLTDYIFSTKSVQSLLATKNPPTAAETDTWTNSDHVPIHVKLDLGSSQAIIATTFPQTSTSRTTINYSKVKSIHTDAFRQQLNKFCIRAQNKFKTSNKQNDDIDQLYKDTIHAFKTAQGTLPRRKIKSDDERNTHTLKHAILGWSETCAEAAKNKREAYVYWTWHGKPRQGPIFDTYQRYKRKFKLALRRLRSQQKERQANQIVAPYISKLKKSTRLPNPPIINNIPASGQAKMWADHFSEVFNDDVTDATTPTTYSQPIQTDEIPDVSYDELMAILTALDTEKAIGLDGVGPWELRHASQYAIDNLKTIYTYMMQNAHFPASMIDHKISVIPKSLKKDLSIIKNWRPIQVQNTSLAIFERLLLERNKERLCNTSREQFGYKTKVGTEMAIAVARSIQGRCYACCIDFSAAFDKISWKRAMRGLEHAQVPYAYRRIIYWSFHIKTFVFWNGELLRVLDPSRGVKQGGILAPYVFAISMQELVDDNLKFSAGALIKIRDSTIFMNTIVYADDILIFSRSLRGLTQLLDNVHNFCSRDNDLSMNSTKSVLLTLNEPDLVFELGDLVHVTHTDYLGTILNDPKKEVERINASFYKRSHMLRTSPITSCSPSVKLAAWRSYSGAYCLSTLGSEKLVRKTAAAHRHLCRTIFRIEVSTYIKEQQQLFPDSFIPLRSTILYTQIAGILISIPEQYERALISLNTRLDLWLLSNFGC